MREAAKEFDYFLFEKQKESNKKGAKCDFNFTLFCNFIISILINELDFNLMRNYSFVETFLKKSFY